MDKINSLKKYFTRQLTAWHATDNDRSLPWKNEKDPYKIWLSEVILQQTRAQQGLPYYLRFIEAFPTIKDMAAAEDEKVFRLWQGLGYYNRCKNMLATARYIVKELSGKFPATYEQLLQLKGIGPYTAAAIASFAFGLPHAVVDGNVYRVLSRFFRIEMPFDITEGKKAFTQLAGELLDTTDSAAYNQAIMDLGATVCSPTIPSCDICPLQKKCVAHDLDLIGLLPVRSKKIVIRNRYFNYLLLRWRDTIWIHKRSASDIWENLHEPYLIETKEFIDKQSFIKDYLNWNSNISPASAAYSGSSKQRLTHQLIETHFYTIDLLKKPAIEDKEGKWVNISELSKLAFPKTVVSFLKNNLYF
jgi:A/G-specific adenine glycosylase